MKVFPTPPFPLATATVRLGILSVSPLNRQCRPVEMGFYAFRFKFVMHVCCEKGPARAKRQRLKGGEAEAPAGLQVIAIVPEAHAFQFAVHAVSVIVLKEVATGHPEVREDDASPVRLREVSCNVLDRDACVEVSRACDQSEKAVVSGDHAVAI